MYIQEWNNVHSLIHTWNIYQKFSLYIFQYGIKRIDQKCWKMIIFLCKINTFSLLGCGLINVPTSRYMFLDY